MSYLAPRQLLTGGPHRFTRQVERLLGQLGFADVVNIDGPDDKGGDLLGELHGQLWVIQCKWRKNGPVARDGVDEVSAAQDHYGADRAVVATNTRPSSDAISRARSLQKIGRRIDFWSGSDLQNLHRSCAARQRIVLRDYQDDAIAKIWSDLAAKKRALLILATGLGKTVVGGEVIYRFLANNSEANVLVVAHTKDLVAQLERSLWRHLPKEVKTQVLTGDEPVRDLRGLTCATTASALSAVKGGYNPALVMVDEVHHVGEDGQYGELLKWTTASWQFGVTATPWRGDHYDIEKYFGAASYTLGIEEGMKRGYLASVDYRLFVDNIDWDAVRGSSENSYTIGELNRKLFLPERDEAISDNLLSAWHDMVEPKAIVFCQTIEHAEQMQTRLRQAPEWRSASTVHNGVPKRDRRQRLLDFRSGRISILLAVDVLNEGVDVPDVNLLCFARVSHSRRIFVQQLGRGLRLREGKSKVVVLDFISDIRRVAALMSMRRQLDAEEIEVIPQIPQPRISFSDLEAGSLLQQWILDVADLETAHDETRLQFLDPQALQS